MTISWPPNPSAWTSSVQSSYMHFHECDSFWCFHSSFQFVAGFFGRGLRDAGRSNEE